MKSFSVLIFALFLIVIAFMPLLETIENGFNSTNGYYGDHLLSKE